MRQIKRYPNRKLYDTTEKRYVTLIDIARLIREGSEVRVTDYASGEDLTAITLTQIIFEQEKRQAGFLPRSVLTGLVQAGGERLSTLRRALALPLGLRHHFDDEIERRLNRLVASGELEEADASRFREKLLSASEYGVGTLGEDERERDVPWLLAQQYIPSRADIATIKAQIEQLSEKVESLLNERR